MSPGELSVAVAVLTRDLRLHDNPVLSSAAAAADTVVPLFVLDDAILRSDFSRPNRATFLVDCLRDLDASLTDRGAGLVVRRGDWVAEIVRVVAETGADVVHVAGDVTRYARSRVDRLTAALGSAGVEVVVHDAALFVVPPGDLAPAGKDHMAVFTPYFRRWEREPTRDPAPTPRALRLPAGLARGRVPAPAELATGETSPEIAAGGETEGRRRMTAWLRSGLPGYVEDHDALGKDNTSRLSPYLHFGAVSPLEVVRRAAANPSPAAQAFVRQVAWRDFHAQVLAARPDATTADYRPRGDRWHRSDEELTAWKEGRTGYPIVDAGMRQLLREGWMHNRARLIVAHFLCKTLYIDWREGARHFVDLLLDADVANNTMNWQWAAGTGTDSRFNRTYNVVLQARRHDPRGDYVRRYVEELTGLDDAYLHEPWLLPEDERDKLGYPAPIVDQAEARDRIRRVRAAQP
ncbi:MAG: deoxyribodipyrimidine photo-lyase [Actinomycetota bacterium]|nr:deoxyribodipyrimidine photo-lyase [Actinomycetota bacterium]